jgi:hypothetical protein
VLGSPAQWLNSYRKSIVGTTANAVSPAPWNKGKIVGQKAPFKLKDIWALSVRLQMENRVRELALLNWEWTASTFGSPGA